MKLELHKSNFTHEYQRIADVEEGEDNVPKIMESTNGLISKIRESQSISYYQHFLFTLAAALVLLTVVYRSSSRQAHEVQLEQPYLLPTTPYKVTNHPDPPTAFWGSVAKPYPTGAFWTNLVVKNGDGAVGVYPYGIKTVEAGIQVSYGAFRRQVSNAAITDVFNIDLQISATQTYVGRGIETYDNISVTMAYKTQGNGKYKVILVKGSPFVTVVYDSATPMVSSPVMKITAVDARLVKDSTGTQYIVTLGNYQKWLVYCSEPVVLSWKDNGLSAAQPLKGFIRVAILPPQNADAAFTQLLNYVQRYPTSASLSFSYPTPTTATVTIQYNSVGTGSLLMLALPHHIPLLPSTLVNGEESVRVQTAFFPIWSIKGKMKAIVGDCWKLTYPLTTANWNYNLNDKLSTQQLDDIARYLIEEVKTFMPAAIDAYSFGKQLGRMTRLALIADNLGIADARQQAIFNLETTLIPWLQGMNADVLLYDKTYGGLVTTQSLTDPFSNFGAGWYSDHHFHFGYFAHAVAALVKLDFPFYEANKAALDSFIRDFCNPDPTDTDFPTVRHKDYFDGHSWASGLFQLANGKGQESSSEAVNAYYGVYLYATALGNTDLTRFAQLLMTMEIQATQFYWHMSNDDIYDNLFSSNRMVGNVGALDVTASTWFGNQLEYVHGINMMPLTPITGSLFDANYVQVQYPVLAARLASVSAPPPVACADNPQCLALNLQGICCPTAEGLMLGCCDSDRRIADEWKSFIYADLAVVDRDLAFNRIMNMGGFGIGNSRANSLFWAATRSPPVTGFNASQIPAKRVLKSSCSANSACDATGMTGECCPTMTGVYLGCCPRT